MDHPHEAPIHTRIWAKRGWWLRGDDFRTFPIIGAVSYGAVGCQHRFSAMSVLARITSFRMTAVSASLGCLLCLALARSPKYGISANVSGTVASDGLPFFRAFGMWSLRPSKKARPSPSILKIEVERANEVLKQFVALDNKMKEKLRIPLERLNSYGLFASEADQAIDIRVCMEALFLDDLNKGGEIRFRLGLRAAHYLGGTDEEKRSIKKAIMKAYDAASTAVHKGNFKTDDDRKTITEVAPILQKALLKKISQGNVEWSDVELGIL